MLTSMLGRKILLTFLEKRYGPNHPRVASSLNFLALKYNAQGNSAKAELLHIRALQIREQALGVDHPDVAESINNLAALYDEMGDHAKAKPLYQRLLEICENSFNPRTPEATVSLFNQAFMAPGRTGITEAPVPSR